MAWILMTSERGGCFVFFVHLLTIFLTDAERDCVL